MTLTSAGNVVTIADGSGFSIKPQSDTVYECAPGVVLDGRNSVAFAFVDGGDNVTIRNCVVQNYATQLQRCAIDGVGRNGWVVENNEVRENAAGGICLGSDSVARDNYVHHNHQIGVKSWDASNVLFENNEVAYNNYLFESDGGWEAGGSKFVNTTGLIIRGNNFHDNGGAGIWLDWDNDGSLIEGNTSEDNWDSGIFLEVGTNSVIRNNASRGNGCGWDVWLWGGQIQVSTSSGVEIYGNTVESGNCGNGITIIQQNRCSGCKTRDISVHHNDISGPGVTGAAQDTGDQAMYDSVSFDFNSYSGQSQFHFNDHLMDFSEFQAAGQEPSGSMN